MATAKQRPRRVAADEAHAWARNLRLNNPSAKLVLSMLTLYVDGDGTCFVGIPSLAHDTELSPQTVRNRLEWLELAGAIVRHAQWVDVNGRRNGDGRGRRTSDLIRLMMDTAQEDLENRAVLLRSKRAGPIQQTGSAVQADPIQEIGSNDGGPDAGTPLTLQRPYDSAEGLISEPEPEPDSPVAPSGGASTPTEIEQEEPEHFGPAWLAWPGHEVMRRDLALAEFRLLSPDKQKLCRAAIPYFFEMQKTLKRDHVPNFHIWIRSRGFDEFPNAKLDQATPAGGGLVSMSYDVASAEGRALKALFGFARTSLFENRGKVIYPLPVTARVLAFGSLPDRQQWTWIEEPAQIAAWMKFLDTHIHCRRTDLLTVRGAGLEARRGFLAPAPWPPRKDGTFGPEVEAA